MCGWTDDASDIDRYHVEIYYMNIGGTGLLEETRSPVHTEDIRPPHNNLRFTCQTSGVYSIQLTVYDRANNTARARQLFVYDGASKMTSTYRDVSSCSTLRWPVGWPDLYLGGARISNDMIHD